MESLPVAHPLMTVASFKFGISCLTVRWVTLHNFGEFRYFSSVMGAQIIIFFYEVGFLVAGENLEIREDSAQRFVDPLHNQLIYRNAGFLESALLRDFLRQQNRSL